MWHLAGIHTHIQTHILISILMPIPISPRARGKLVIVGSMQYLLEQSASPLSKLACLAAEK
ncbi:hypothetical protein EON65_44500 [archaeon]|nr:MAG: hypothetical protein EON65_44500 [archaeon]